MWYVENINGDGSEVRVYYNTFEEAKSEAEWTLGYVGFEPEKDLDENIPDQELIQTK